MPSADEADQPSSDDALEAREETQEAPAPMERSSEQNAKEAGGADSAAGRWQEAREVGLKEDATDDGNPDAGKGGEAAVADGEEAQAGDAPDGAQAEEAEDEEEYRG